MSWPFENEDYGLIDLDDVDRLYGNIGRPNVGLNTGYYSAGGGFILWSDDDTESIFNYNLNPYTDYENAIPNLYGHVYEQCVQSRAQHRLLNYNWSCIEDFRYNEKYWEKETIKMDIPVENNSVKPDFTFDLDMREDLIVGEVFNRYHDDQLPRTARRFFSQERLTHAYMPRPVTGRLPEYILNAPYVIQMAEFHDYLEGIAINDKGRIYLHALQCNLKEYEAFEMWKAEALPVHLPRLTEKMLELKFNDEKLWHNTYVLAFYFCANTPEHQGGFTVFWRESVPLNFETCSDFEWLYTSSQQTAKNLIKDLSEDVEEKLRWKQLPKAF
jgi:hypothetical protein